MNIYKITVKNTKGEATAEPFLTDDVKVAEKHVLSGNEVLCLEVSNAHWRKLVMRIEAIECDT